LNTSLPYDDADEEDGTTTETTTEQYSVGVVGTTLEARVCVPARKYQSSERRQSVDTSHGERCGGRSIGRDSRESAKSVREREEKRWTVRRVRE